MIQLKTDAQLSIILPNMNKALGEAIKNATPEQLETLKEGKDIKGLLTSVFQDKTASAKSDTVLLDILKNSASFKNMGTLSDTLTSLIKELKTAPDIAAKSSVFENFLKNITTIDPKSLKNQMANSGIFMESKFASALQKIPDLTQTLDQLRTILTKDPSVESKALQQKINTLMESPHLQSASHQNQSASLLSDGLKEIRAALSTFLSKNDPLYSLEVSALAQKLDFPITLQELKSTLSELYGLLLRSNASQANTLLDSIENLLKTVNSLPDEEVKTFAEILKTTIREGNISKEVPPLLSKLEKFTHPKELIAETFLKESMATDLKSNLLSLRDELHQSGDPVSPKLLEHVDKALTHIDYHQLLSYLGSSNSIYFPFSWDMLESGSLAFKKINDKKFYCEIHLKLKKYGELNLMMALYDENQLELQAHTEKPELKKLIHDHIGELRTSLIQAGLTPRAIRVFEMNEIKTPLKESYSISERGSDMGFEVTV